MPRLVDRRNERAALDQLLADVRAQRSRVLVLRGEAGVGKTALVEHLAAASTGCRLARATGVESEMELPFSGLHQLCGGLLGGVAALPAPQRDALSRAFGLTGGEPADRFLIGLALLTLLSAAAEERPLVCLVDDAQWLDAASSHALAFVARRLLAEPVGLVFAVREPSDTPDLRGLPEYTLLGLNVADSRTLLESASLGRLDAVVRDRIVAETRGNPLALLELPRRLTADELAGGFVVPAARPLAGHMEEAFLRRVLQLPEESRRLLLLAAADPLGDGLLVRRSAHRLGIDPRAAVAAEDDGLLDFGAHVRFRHPLVRSAAYRAGTVADRRDVHDALAEETDRDRDPDRRAWHRAHATAGPDGEVAAELERSAVRAQRRGGVAAAAAFLERAADLTPDPVLRAERTLAAAQAKFDAAAYDAADALLSAAAIDPLDGLQQARSALLRARIAFARSRGGTAPALFLEAATRFEPHDVQLANDAHLEGLGAAISAGRAGARPAVRELATAARAMPPRPLPLRPTDRLLDGLATLYTDGHATAVGPLRSALETVRAGGEAEISARGWFWLAWLIAGELWDDSLQQELATAAVQGARDLGALGHLPIALTYRAAAHIHAGEFTAAAGLIEESDWITEATGQAMLGYASVSLTAWSARSATALDRYAVAFDDARLRGEGRVMEMIGYLVALLNNALGRFEDALEGARDACQYDGLGVRGLVLVELIEASSRCATPVDATQPLRELEERALAAGTEWGLGALARSRALLSHGAAAEACYLEAIDRLSKTRVVVHLARAHLVYGEWLRRENRRLDARAQLRLAYDLLHAIGAHGFAERADRELVATGDTARARAATPFTDLTSQEATIARLAADGRTNAEIGSELFISPRTVEYHLGKVYAKLGLTARRELRHAVPQLPT